MNHLDAIRRWLAAASFAMAVLLTAPATADVAADVAALGDASFSEKIALVGALAASGDTRVLPVLNALLEGDLHTVKADDSVVIATEQGDVFVLTDPLSGAEVGQAGKRDIKKIRVNNKVRGAIRGALGGLTLLSDDPATRLAAAQAVFKTREQALVPILETAIERETEAKVRRQMQLALAATRLTGETELAPRLAALETLATAPTPDVRALVAEYAAPGEADADLRAAAIATLAEIEQRLAFWGVIENIFQGLSLGSVLLLAAVGLAITFGVMGVINMAHGELVMLGAYTTFMVQQLIRDHAPGLFEYSLFMAIPAAFLLAGAVGVAIERGIIRYLYGRPLETLLATWGLSLILRQLVRTVFGPTNRLVGSPEFMSGNIELVGGLVLTYNRIYIIVFSLLVVGLLALLLRRSSFGLQMRAVTQNRAMAGAMGIRTGRVDALTFGLGSGIAGVAGVALSQIDNVSPNLGQSYIIDSFMVVVFGGVGNLWGTLVGAFSLGLFNKFLEPYAGAVLAKILVLVAIILFIQKRPRGLFALKGRAVEA